MSPPAVLLDKAAFAGDQKPVILGDIRIPWLPPRAFTAIALLLLAHSPVPGRQGTPMTIVEFFDPACAPCRAFCPIVESPMAQYREDVRLVVRYAPFHPGPDPVVKLLAAAWRQRSYPPTLEAVLQAQPTWAAGRDIGRAREDMARPEMQALPSQDVEDLTALQVSRTPTFFVGGRSLSSFGPDRLAALVAEEAAKADRQVDG